MPDITYQIERWADCWQEIQPLWEAHAEETGLSIVPDNKRYALIEREGLLILATMRADGDLVGIHRSVIGPNLHHQGQSYACSDGWFVQPAWRRGQSAIKLLRCAEDAARKRGITFFYQASPSEHDIGPILKRDGWQMSDTLYRKEM